MNEPTALPAFNILGKAFVILSQNQNHHEKAKATCRRLQSEINDLTVCLLNEYQWLNLLSGKQRPYDQLIERLILLGEKMEKDDLNEEHKLTNLASCVNEKKPVLTRWLRQLYEDLLTLNFDTPNLFRKDGCSLYHLFCRDPNVKSYANLNLWLEKPLQTYDEFQIFFLKGKISMPHFWVERIHHEYEKLRTTAWLKVGFANKYRETLLDRAKFENQIGLKPNIIKWIFKLIRS
jgi:hypothetical protein